MEKKKIVVIIDAGHGGIDKAGRYTTAPSKMTVFKDFTIYEGVINRHNAKDIASQLIAQGYEVHLVYDDVEDWSLGKRCALANKIKAKYPTTPCLFMSIHSNASPVPTNPGRGIEVHTSPGNDMSDPAADILCKELKQEFPEFAFREDKSDGDMDKESRFYVILPENNKCEIRILPEFFFFDNEKEARLLLQPVFRKRICDATVRAINKINDSL